MRPEHAFAIAVGERVEPLRFERFRDVGPDQLDGSHELAHQAGKLPALISLLPRPPPHASHHGPNDDHEHGRADQGHERQPPRQAHQDRDVDDDETDVLYQGGERRRDDGLHAVGVVDHACEQLSAARTLEEVERQRLQVPEQPHAQVAHDVLLDRDTRDRRHVRQHVLEHERDYQHHHDVAQRGAGRARAEQWADDHREQALDGGAPDGGKRRLAEQGTQEGDQQHERGAVEHRRHERGHEVGDEQERVGAKQQQEPAATAHSACPSAGSGSSRPPRGE